MVAPPAPMLPYPNPLLRQQHLEARRQHPLFTSCVLMLLVEIINSRLFTTVGELSAMCVLCIVCHMLGFTICCAGALPLFVLHGQPF